MQWQWQLRQQQLLQQQLSHPVARGPWRDNTTQREVFESESDDDSVFGYQESQQSDDSVNHGGGSSNGRGGGLTSKTNNARIYINAQPVDGLPSLHTSAARPVGNTDNGPPSPWATGDTKRRIIDELKKETSDIHLYYSDRSNNGKYEINYSSIRDKYASPNHDMKKFRPNMKRLIDSFAKKTGPFKEESANETNKVEPWYTSNKKKSLGYILLHDLYRFEATRMNNMPAAQIWAAYPQFQLYPLDDFKKYNTNMKSLVSKKLKIVAIEEKYFKEDMTNEPEKQSTCRNTPFWNKHAAKKLLAKDIRDGLDNDLQPAQLRMTRPEYQEFPPEFFRKRIYEIKSKQKCGPYWQAKRNKNALKSHHIEAERLRKEWAEDDEMLELMGSLRVTDD